MPSRKEGKMPKKISITILCGVTIVVAVLLTVTQLMALEKPQSFDKYRPISGSNEIEVAGVRIRYTRDDNGCVKFVEFYNNPDRCSKDPACLDSLRQLWDKCMKDEDCKSKLEGKTWPPEVEPGWVPAKKIDDKSWPKMWGEYLVRAGSTKGESGSDVCDEWTFTVAGSPGWHCTVSDGDIYCKCIGDYYGPPEWSDPPYNHCCAGGACVRHP
jgi:hypothetical protein